jgi:hypothetical protein
MQPLLPSLMLLVGALATLAATTASPPGHRPAGRSFRLPGGHPLLDHLQRHALHPGAGAGAHGLLRGGSGGRWQRNLPHHLSGRWQESRPIAGSSNQFAGVDFFGSQPPLRLSMQDQSDIRGIVPQAGLIGTDLLRNHIVTLDYASAVIHRAAPERPQQLRSLVQGSAIIRHAGLTARTPLCLAPGAGREGKLSRIFTPARTPRLGMG